MQFRQSIRTNAKKQKNMRIDIFYCQQTEVL